MSFESLHLMPVDLGALAFALATWIFYSIAVSGRLFGRTTLTTAMDRQRENWMRNMARRDLRMIDTGIMAGLQQGTAFFASTCIFAIGGCLALLGAADQVMSVLTDLPIANVTSRGQFEIKVIGLLILVSYSFFKFAWSYRLFNYCSILIGAVPIAQDNDPATDKAIERAARMNVLGGRHFNAGLRGIFFALGYLGWFVGPAVFVLTTLLVFLVLLRRQFFSNARNAAMM
ncbi:MAG: DUF599 family protein [Mesorhizobium sp.]